jgi:DNA-binding winged helix-turn-helix (wHTH) protein
MPDFCTNPSLYFFVQERNDGGEQWFCLRLSGRRTADVAGPQLGLVTPLARIVLAREAEFTLGGLRVTPSKREVVAGDQRELLQPRIMQVLVALARRRGSVVSHDELIAACWDGCAVSDDAIHRCIARLRRLSETHGGFALETVPRVGYQLIEAAALAASLRQPGRAAAIAAAVLATGALLVAAGFAVVR